MKRIADDDVQYLLQYLTTNLVARGYHHHCLTTLPDKKRDRWPGIVQRLAEKYALKGKESIFSLSRDQRARRKAKGLLNAALVWWRDQVFILATEGRDDVGLHDHERLVRWPSARVQIAASKTYVYEVIQVDGRSTLTLSKRCLADKIAYFEDAARRLPVPALVESFGQFDRLVPSYAGCFRQKRKVASAIVLAARRAGRKDVTPNLFQISTRRRHVGPSDE